MRFYLEGAGVKRTSGRYLLPASALVVLLALYGLSRFRLQDSPSALVSKDGANFEKTTYSSIKPKVIPLDVPVQNEGIGGIISADVDDDRRKDFIITKGGHIAVYDDVGEKLWGKKLDIN
jgi:hypothetical protein